MNNPDTLPDVTPDNRNGLSAPTPPNGDLGIRTMASDFSSLRSSGGMSTEPKAFNPKDLLGNEPVYSLSGQNANGDTIINNLPPEPTGGKNKKLILILGAIGFLLILAVVGYFILWPLVKNTFLGSQVVPPPAPVPVVIVAPEPVPLPTPPTPPPFVHTSLFPVSASVEVAGISITGNLSVGLKTGIRDAFGPTVAVPAFKEPTFTLDGATVDAYVFLSQFFVNPISGSTLVEGAVERDFTAFVYKDKDGIWPGYVFTLKNADAATEPSLSFIQGVQSSASQFYIDDPGAQKSDFKDGAKLSPNFVWVKYKPYTMAGASFNIGQVIINGKNYLIVSTSYEGLKMASQKLGF